MILLLNVVNLNKTVLNIKGIKRINKMKPLNNVWLWNDQTPIYWNNDSVIIIKK